MRKLVILCNHSDRKKKVTAMKNKVLKRLMIFGLVCSMTLSMAPLPTVAAGTEAHTEKETKAPETRAAESETKVTETKSEEKESETKASETTAKGTKTPETTAKETETEKKEASKSESKELKVPESDDKETEASKPAEEVLDMTERTAREGEEGLVIEGGTEGKDYTVTDKVISITGSTPLKISGNSGECIGKIIIEKDAKLKLELSDVMLQSPANESALEVKEGASLELIQTNVNRLTVETDNKPVIVIEKGAELILSGTGMLDISGLSTKGTGKDITMSRGAVPTDKPASLKIKDGTITAKMGIAVEGAASQKVSVQISGGSVDLKALSQLDRKKISLTSDGKTSVYKTGILLKEANVQVEDFMVQSDGKDYEYGYEGIYTDKDKMIYVYLPAKKASAYAQKAGYDGQVQEEDYSKDADQPNMLLKSKADLKADEVTIPSLDYGYTSEQITSASVTVKNSSVNATTIKAELTGDDAKKFELTLPGDMAVPGKKGTADGEHTGIKIRPVSNLDAGTYKATLKLTDAEGGTTAEPVNIPVTFTVNKVKLTAEAKIDEKVYDGKRAASGTVTLKGGVRGETPLIDDSKVTFMFNNANVKDATTVTVDNLVLDEKWANNYELEKTTFDVKASIKKAPSKRKKEDLKTPSVTVVYSKSKGAWLPQFTTYKGQEYLFFGKVTTSLTKKNKNSANWAYGTKEKVKNRKVDLKLKSGVTYTVWTRFAADDNHEASDGELMAYTTFSISQNSKGGTASDSYGNKINGITEGTTYKTGSAIKFGAVGAGMSNTSPKTGDVRYLPVSWKVSDEHTWSSAPYEAAFTLNQAGSYTLQVTFRKQTYSNNAWTSTGTTSVCKVNFKMAANGANGTGYTTGTGTTTTNTGTNTGSSTVTKTTTAAKTGDDSPILPLAVVCIVSLAVLAGLGLKKRKANKKES